MKILVIAEHDNHTINAATENVITAGLSLGDGVDVLVAGHQCRAVAEKLSILKGVNQVLMADHQVYQHHLPENCAKLIAQQASEYDAVLGAANTFGKNLLPRVAALLDVEQVSDVIEIQSETIYKRPIYAGNIIQTVENKERIKVLTIRTTAFAGQQVEQDPVQILDLDTVIDNTQSRFVGLEQTQSTRPDLTAAKVVVSGGRGFQNSENFTLIEKLADALGAAIGATRAAVDAGFVANDYQIGQTGKIVAPELYIAIGISGAIQHLAGMKDSKYIVAINKDPDAPIFQIADVGIVGDLFEILPALEEALKKQNLIT